MVTYHLLEGYIEAHHEKRPANLSVFLSKVVILTYSSMARLVLFMK